jgi:hypothetical protein
VKNSNDTIEIAIFRLVAHCLNQLRHGVPVYENKHYQNEEQGEKNCAL